QDYDTLQELDYSNLNYLQWVSCQNQRDKHNLY
uniref:Uncharacterized protein n=1 Tax=Amphimedon queenslandica TaxID=400682 RepID=A0A1X7TR76_AMPQE